MNPLEAFATTDGVNMPTIYPVIMCGGAGSRLWPASRPATPKQFLALAGKRSLFQETVLRIAPLIAGSARILIVAGVNHAAAISRDLSEIGVEATVLLEPEARDSGPAMAAAAAFVHRLDPKGVIAVLASDHHVPDSEAFRAAILTAAEEAVRGRIVTLGVAPTQASSAYGYIRPKGPGLSQVASFVEKPDPVTAAGYVADGYLWNSGNFIVAAHALLDELAVHAPAVGQAARAAVENAKTEGTVLLDEAFRTAPKISIDYAVMEKSDRTSVLPVHFAWSDLGAWDSIHDTGTGASGQHISVDTNNTLVRAAEDMLVATVGVSNLAVIVERDSVLVCALDRSQSVKAVVERLRVESPRHLDPPADNGTNTFAGFTEWMRTAALPLWATLGVHPSGAFIEAMTPQGRPAETRRRARVQSRQIFVMARAGALGWAGPWRERVELGLERFLLHYRRADGAIRNALSPDGDVMDDRALLYEQAFGLLALSAAHAAGVMSQTCLDQAEAMLDRLLATRLPQGGWIEDGDHPFQANANMHLFEAAQAWAARGVDPRWQDIADHLANLAMDHFVDGEGGFLREFFGQDWQPAAGDDGSLVEPGHQFEWSWLLSRHALTRGDDRAMEIARKLYARGLEGIDARLGVAVDAMQVVDTGALAVRAATARLWPQTEWLRAAIGWAILETGENRLARLTEARCAMKALALYLRPNGTWYDCLAADGRLRPEPAPASSLYHIMGAFDALGDAGRDGLFGDQAFELN